MSTPDSELRAESCEAVAPSPRPARPRLPQGRVVAKGREDRNVLAVQVARPGTVPHEILVHADELSPELLDGLRKDIPDLPKLDTAERKGGLDLRLEDDAGAHVKSGLVSIEGPGGTTSVPVARRPAGSASAACRPAAISSARRPRRAGGAAWRSRCARATSRGRPCGSTASPPRAPPP